MELNIWFWVGFNIFVLAMLAVDLFVFQYRPHAVSLKEAGFWSALWVALSLLFCVGIYFYFGQQPALEFLTAYIVEKSLSVDNIFVFVLLFSFFGVPAGYQHRVLFWGILGALVMRGIFISVGVYLFEQFHWLIYVFGGFLVYTGVRMAIQGEEEIDFENNRTLKLVRRFLPITKDYREERFFVRENGVLFATPLFVALILIEITDLIFAIDSIPAVLAITSEPFIAYTSNIMAILGLRALYFLLAGVMEEFRYLKFGLAIILSFVGVKMLIADIYHIPVSISLAIIAVVLTTSILASWLIPKGEEDEAISNEQSLETDSSSKEVLQQDN